MMTFEEVLAVVLRAGLYDDGRVLYSNKYRAAFSNVGIWQQPDELAAFLCFVQRYDVRSFLEIGTFHGQTFQLLSDFLTTLCPETQCCTVDLVKHPQCVPDSRYRYHLGTSADFKGQIFDLVFIDGDHSAAASRADYENVGRHARLCAFHDIDDEFIARDYPDGGCPQTWREVKAEKANTHDIFEFVAADKPCRNMGIGLLVRK
jgi:hypothetical protein